MISHSNRGVIFRLAFGGDALDAEPRELVAQPRQRALVEEAGKIERGIGHDFAAADADEQLEEFALDCLDGRGRRCLAERRMGHAERRSIGAQRGEAPQQISVRSAPQQGREQRIFACARRVGLVDGDGVRSAVEVGAQHGAIDVCHAFNRQHALGGNVLPTRHGWLRNADFAGERANAASGTNGLIEPRTSHRPDHVMANEDFGTTVGYGHESGQ
jgi:hypothetical protein